MLGTAQAPAFHRRRLAATLAMRDRGKANGGVVGKPRKPTLTLAAGHRVRPKDAGVSGFPKRDQIGGYHRSNAPCSGFGTPPRFTLCRSAGAVGSASVALLFLGGFNGS